MSVRQGGGVVLEECVQCVRVRPVCGLERSQDGVVGGLDVGGLEALVAGLAPPLGLLVQGVRGEDLAAAVQAVEARQVRSELCRVLEYGKSTSPI